MKLIGLEEHFVTPAVLDAWSRLDPVHRDVAFAASAEGETGRRLLELGEERRSAMAATGLDVQVLSLTTPALQNLPAADARHLQEATNDVLAETVRNDPEHFQGLAALATSTPETAADELRRAVTVLGLDGAMLYGRTGATNLDDHSFWPVFEAAQDLCVPLHLHPQSPPPAVREHYYAGFPPEISAGFATHGIGWHYDAGVQFLRLVLRGVFDQFPDLQIVLGHWGELVLFYLERVQHLASSAGTARPLAEYVRDNLYVTPSGIRSRRYLAWAIEVIGTERIMFATDYLFEASSLSGARAFLEQAPLDDTARESIAFGNWERVRAGIRR
ncbi:amidohydrolase family protein [Amycolatopsis orientalis]|uniref:amidohydrolase family protein n=1 Tax=Amycolatopsis orientalis TaxID=31958 RepID=UPI0003AA7CF7|nr:amidohydrolase family protein [Amycolatopsis orientalis]